MFSNVNKQVCFLQHLSLCIKLKKFSKFPPPSFSLMMASTVEFDLVAVLAIMMTIWRWYCRKKKEEVCVWICPIFSKDKVERRVPQPPSEDLPLKF